MTPKHIGFIGPGKMGSGIIKNLLRNQLKVTILVYQPEPQLPELEQLGASLTDSLSELAAETDCIMLALPSSAEVEDVVLRDDGLYNNLRPGSVVVDFGTSLTSSTLMIAEKLRERKIEMLDAGMTGGPKQSQQGSLTLMVGGKRQVYEQYLPILRFIARNIFYVGPNGCGHTVKLINNFLNMVNQAAVAEILPFAARYGVDLDALYSVILKSGGRSFVFENNVPRIYKRDFDVNFQLKLCRKDLDYVCRLGKDKNVSLPLANSTLQIFNKAMDYGLGEQNHSSLIKMWEDSAKVEVKSEGRTVSNDGLSGTDLHE